MKNMKKTLLTALVLCVCMIFVLSACAAPASAPSASQSKSDASASVASSAPASASASVSAAPSESASASTSTSASRDNQFIIGLECAYAPYNWTQKDNSNGAVEIGGGAGYAGGYDIEIGKLIAKSLNKTLVIKKIEWNGLVPACQSGIIDAVIAGMSPTAERKQSISFSNTYCKVSMGVVVKKGSKYETAKSLADFAGAKITAQLNTFHYALIDQMQGVKKKTAMDDFPAMRVALESGIIDGYVSEKPEGISASAANKNFAFVEFPEGSGFKANSDDVLLAIGIKKENTELLNKVNEILSGISEEQRTKIMDEAIKNQPSAQ